jgi:hypothetical protein
VAEFTISVAEFTKNACGGKKSLQMSNFFCKFETEKLTSWRQNNYLL